MSPRSGRAATNRLNDLQRRKLVASAAMMALIMDVAAAAASDRILFNSNGPSAVDLYIANADGTGERKLLATSAHAPTARTCDD